MTRLYTRLGQDWPRWCLSVGPAGAGVWVRMTRRNHDKDRPFNIQAIPRPLLDELGAVIAEACGRMPREAD